MSVTDDIEKVFTGSVPKDVVASVLARIMRRAMAEALVTVANEGETYIAGSQLRNAVGGYLDLHAKDKGLRRAEDETDDQLRDRLRTPPKAITPQAIVEALQAIVGDVGDVLLVELPLDAAFFNRESFFFDYQAWFGGGRGVVIAFIPAEADAKSAAEDALRSKVAAGKLWMVYEYEVGYGD